MLPLVARFLAALVLVLAGAGAGAVPAAPVSSQPAVGGSPLILQPSTPIVGERVRLRTRLASRVVRRVWLQQHVGSGWQTVAQTRSAPNGLVTVSFRARAAAARLRVLAPAVRVDGRRYGTVTSVARVVVGTPQAVGFTTSRDSTGTVDLRVRVSHPRAGRTATVQSRTPGGRWAAVSRRVLTGGRTVDLRDVATVRELTGRDLRVMLGPYNGAPTRASAVRSSPRVGVVAVMAENGVDLAAVTSGAVDTVRFFVDGNLVAEDRAAPWGAHWPTRGGTHDVMARAIGAQGGVLSGVELVHAPSPKLSADTGVAEGFALEEVQRGFELPTSAAALPTGRVFVTEKAGTVQVLEPASDTGYLPAREVLDLRSEVYDDGDAGLIGIALAPDFADTGHVYLSLVRDDGVDERRTQQVVRFTWDGDVLDPGSRMVVLGRVTGDACAALDAIRTPDCIPLIGGAHTIGDLAFDPQGRLLVGVGDGSLYGTSGLVGRPETLRAQDPEVLAGKVLRVDPVTGRGVPDNPLFGGDGSSNASRVLALGFRNPFRFAERDGLLVVGDVGENRVEELDTLHLDDVSDEVRNYGWPCFEGEEPTELGDVSSPDSPWHPCAAVRASGVTVTPSHVYAHQGPGGSISGGAFLDDVSYPAGWRGRYVFGDYARNRIWVADITGDGHVSDVDTLAESTAADRPVKFFAGPDGLVWMVEIATGAVRRIRYTGQVSPDRCEVGTFRRSFHDLDGPDSAFDADYPDDEYRWLFPYAAAHPPPDALAEPTCEDDVALAPTTGAPWATEEAPDLRAHPGDRFATVWSGRVNLDAGTYRFAVLGSEWMRLWVDDEVVHDFYANEFWTVSEREHVVVLGPGQHTIRVEHLHGDQETARAGVTWSRVGAPPSISLDAPTNGALALDGLPWRVSVGDPDGDDLAVLAEKVELAVDFLHYSGGEFHAHPEGRITGLLDGTLSLDDVHAPGSGVVRLRARVTDSSGASVISAPVYVCFPGGAAGPCAD